jgi:ribonuclease E
VNAEARGEGREGRGRNRNRNGRRDERGPRQDEGNQAESEAQSALGFADTTPPTQGDTGQPHGDASAAPAEGRNPGEGREHRSRDRYGRDRGNRQERGEKQAATQPMEEVQSTAAVRQEPAPTVVAPAPMAATAVAPVAAPVAATTATSGSMPKVQGYALPTESLQQVAQSSGLQWVNSDANKIAAVQAAIAAEPKPVHVPRERPAPVVVDTGPLVLVETRRDLRNMSLPFEENTAS